MTAARAHASPVESDAAADDAIVVTAPEAVLGRIRARCRRRLRWLAHLEGETGRTQARSGRIVLEGKDEPRAEAEWYANNPAVAAENREIAAYERALADDQRSPLGRLCRTFQLSEFERDLLHVCLALELDPRLGPVYAELHGHPESSGVTEPLVERLCGAGLHRLAAGAPLSLWRLVHSTKPAPGDPVALALDPDVLLYIAGVRAQDRMLAGRVTEPAAAEPLGSWPIARIIELTRRTLQQGVPLRVWLLGPSGSGRKTLAACVTRALGAGALAIDTTGVSDDDWPEFHLRAERQAALFGAVLVWHGRRPYARPPSAPSGVPLHFVAADVDAVVVPEPGLFDERVVMPSLALDERRDLWRRFVPESAGWSRADQDQVFERYRLTPGDIRKLGDRGVATAAEAAEICRSLTRDRLEELARLIECPFSREDLLLPARLDEALEDLLFEARERARFWERPSARRLFPRGTGLVALMSGSPGTGKTMAAQVIAAELGLDLFRIDLASSISKYIGETAKNLRRIFARAAEMNAVLLFDEADALFSKRTEVKDSHDRYANTDTNYLLQLLEGFPGIALLASNKKQNIDSAFIRRIRYVLDFPRPDQEQRLILWRRLVRELEGPDVAQAVDGALERIASVIDMTGAQIKLSILSAIFTARKQGEPLALQHLYRGIQRELSKEGRAIAPHERERIERP